MRNTPEPFLCTVRKIFHKIHLVLGLAVGLIIIIIALTGCLYAFQEEIQNLTQSYRFVDERSTPFIPPSRLKEIAQRQLPGKTLHSVQYGHKQKAAVLLSYGGEPAYFYLLYLNPYTGEVLKVKDMNADFFRFILDGHFYLWLPHKIGQPVVATATLIFMVMLITGIILWWPKNKAAAKQRFSIKWNTKWRRKNYDLHNILGFYASWVLIFIAVTGLVWGFQWFAKSLYWITSGGKTSIEYIQATSDTTKAHLKNFTSGMDKLWRKTTIENPFAESIKVDFPDDKYSVIGISTNTDAGTYWRSDNRFYDQYTFTEVPVQHAYGRFNSLSTADKILRMNYDIHVGAIFGLAGKFLAFFASFICASLPITGFIIWWGRQYKERSKPVSAPASVKYIEFKSMQVEETIEAPGTKPERRIRLRRSKKVKSEW